MYALPELAAANQALWDGVRQGIAGLPERLTPADAVPERIRPGTVFTQVCGFPLLRQFRGQATLLGVPCYALEGCEGAVHRAAFVVRAAEPAQHLAGMRGRVFGCNSPHSNTGMNLPRLSLARVAGGQPFFAGVVWTGGHMASLVALAAGTIDLCSVDCVTWGLAQRHCPERTAGLRVLAWTDPSPCLPFVTAVGTPGATQAALVGNLLRQSSPGLCLTHVAPANPAAYDVLDGYEREATALGYPVLA